MGPCASLEACQYRIGIEPKLLRTRKVCCDRCVSVRCRRRETATVPTLLGSNGQRGLQYLYELTAIISIVTIVTTIIIMSIITSIVDIFSMIIIR